MSISMADINYIQTQENLQNLCDKILSLGEDDCLSLDTEFTRVKTFYPELDLIQICIKEETYLIDPLSEIKLVDFVNAINSTKASILLFSCREDLEVLSNLSYSLTFNRQLPKRIIDIQLLLSFANRSYSQGLQSALSEYLNIEIKKEHTTSDWQKRPLSGEQLIYAKEDVIYLERLYKTVISLFNVSDIRLTFFNQEMEEYKNRALIETKAEDSYLSVSGAGSLNKKQLYILSYLCHRRMLLAIENNEALNRVITTKALCNICRCRSHNFSSLDKCGMKYGAIKAYGKIVIEWFNQSISQMKKNSNLVDSIALAYDHFANDKEYTSKIKALKQFLSKKSLELCVCKELLVNKQLVNDFFYKKYYKQIPILQSSWYKDALGEIPEF